VTHNTHQPSILDQVLSLNSLTADLTKRLTRLERNYFLLRAQMNTLLRSNIDQLEHDDIEHDNPS
jgi:hypothetical protein